MNSTNSRTRETHVLCGPCRLPGNETVGGPHHLDAAERRVTTFTQSQSEVLSNGLYESPDYPPLHTSVVRCVICRNCVWCRLGKGREQDTHILHTHTHTHVHAHTAYTYQEVEWPCQSQHHSAKHNIKFAFVLVVSSSGVMVDVVRVGNEEGTFCVCPLVIVVVTQQHHISSSIPPSRHRVTRDTRTLTSRIQLQT